MAGNQINMDEVSAGSRIQRIGLILALIFYVVSVIFVVKNHYGSGFLDPNLKVITIAHWQLEDGFREGIDAAIRDFEALYAAKGQKVKVVQSAIPTRTYKQWLQTQLISGKPADIIELNCSPNMMNMYFTPLSNRIGMPNPYNQGTPLENIPWSDTYVDDMNFSLDGTFVEYFGVSLFFFTNRLYVNCDLLSQATGRDKLPEDLPEWLEMCEKVREYGKKIGTPLIPIGSRGFDRGTINLLFSYYYQQINGDMSDRISTYEQSCSQLDQLRALRTGEMSREKLLAANEIVHEIGQYFADGFSAIDLEQTKFLFSSGRVAFFPEGTWNAFSMVNNAPFKVGICTIPVIGTRHRFSKYYLEPPIENAGGAQSFGIPKATKNFDLSLDFLHYITSYNVNRKIVVDHARWLSILKKIEYDTPLMKSIQPVSGGSYQWCSTPLSSGRARMDETQETALLNNSEDAGGVVFDGYVRVLPKLIEDMEETVLNEKRNFINIETMRTVTAIGDLANLSEEEHAGIMRKSLINFENLVSRNRALRGQKMLKDELQLLLQREAAEL